MQFKDIVLPLGKIGDWVGTATQWIISNISKLGVNITPLQSQIISLLIFGFGIYLILKFLKTVRGLVKWGLIILLIILIISILVGIFT